MARHVQQNESDHVMILIAGGRNDPNLAVLIDRLTSRSVPFRSLLSGPGTTPRLRIDIQEQTFELNGERLILDAYFIREDVFLYHAADIGRAQEDARNWYHAVRGWAESSSRAKLFNRRTSLRENNKIQNLMEAIAVDLPVPKTIATNDFNMLRGNADTLIQKPLAGGEYTTLLSALISDEAVEVLHDAPRFVQPRLHRPEVRIYRIGKQLLAFEIRSPELDYRQTRNVTIEPIPVPQSVGAKLLQLCDRLELDFGAADFMLDDDGELTFLEVNSQPMFAAFDRTVDGALCDAIIDSLTMDKKDQSAAFALKDNHRASA